MEDEPLSLEHHHMSKLESKETVYMISLEYLDIANTFNKIFWKLDI